jgi:RNA polymerase sigma-70 factor, ECF subfamily
MKSSPNDPLTEIEIKGLVRVAENGDTASLQTLFKFFEERLRRLIALRVDYRILRRVDVDDVLQEVYLQASLHLKNYLTLSEVPFFAWLRGIAVNVLLELQRRHLGTQKRDARREIPLTSSSLEASSSVLSWQLVDCGTSPSNAAMREEAKMQLEDIINQLSSADKEIVALRHYEQLSPEETAAVLDISKKAAGMRYLRALKRLRELLADASGGLSGWQL